jgi:AcrR family transcriptional regulator
MSPLPIGFRYIHNEYRQRGELARREKVVARVGLSARRLVLAGAQLADEAGFEQVTVSALARRFDVKVASLYSHVKGTEDLRAGVAQLALEEMADRGAAALAGRSGKEALAALGDVYRDYAREHPGRYAAARFRLDLRAAAASAGVRHADMARAVLRGYDLAEPAATHAVRLLGSVFHGYVELESSGGFAHSAPDSQESWTRIVDALDALLRNWPAD